jgi:hypothetical protein
MTRNGRYVLQGKPALVVDAVGCCWASDSLLLSVVGTELSDAGWDAYIAYGEETAKSAYVALTFSPHTSPNSAQRARLAQRIAQQMRLCRRVALVSDVLLARVAVTAMSWLTVHRIPMRAFKVGSSRTALAWLAEEMPFDRGEVEITLAALVRDVGMNPLAFGLRGAPDVAD